MLRPIICFIALAMAGFALPAGAATAGAPYEINTVLSMTGPVAFQGKESAQALAAIETYVNATGGIAGRPVKFVIADDGSSAQTAVQLVSGLVAKGVPVILGPGFTQTCAAIVPLVAANGPVEYCFSPGNIPPPGGFAFSATASPFDIGTILLKYFKLRGWTRIAVLYSNDATGQLADRNFDRSLTDPALRGVHFVVKEHFNPGDINVTAQLAKIAGSDAQALIAFTSGTAFGTILHAAKDVGLKIPIGTSNGNISYQLMQGLGTLAPDNVYFPGVTVITGARSIPGPTRDAQLALIKTYSAAGIKIDFINQSVWDPAIMIVGALRRLGPDATAAQLHAYLEGLHGWIGTYGAYDFHSGDQRGVGSNAVVIDRWDTGTGAFAAASGPGGELLK